MKNSITFDVEDVKPASTPLETAPFSSFASNFNPHIEASSHQNEELVDFGSHAFLNALHRAYAEHRPFVLSPDMIWLLIAQGFSQHVNANARELRHLFVDFEGKETLKYENDNIVLGDPNSPWELIFEGLTKETEKHCGKELSEIFTTNFSTTTKIDRAVNQLTLLNTLKPFFEYVVIGAICGIPQITLEGNFEDWSSLIDKAKKLKKYNLEWWIDSIIPILEKIALTSKNEIDNEFWLHIFKIHTPKEYGTSDYFDGWIVKLFPYYANGHKSDLKSIAIHRIKDLPDQMHALPFIFKDTYSPFKAKMEMIGGFIGASQNKRSLSIRPETGWLIGYASEEDYNLFPSKSSDNLVIKNLISFPKIALSHEKIYSIELHFINQVDIPEELFSKEIQELIIYGKISKEEIKTLAEKMNNTVIQVNGKTIFNNAISKEDFQLFYGPDSDFIVVNSNNWHSLLNIIQEYFDQTTNNIEISILKQGNQICLEFIKRVSYETFIFLFMYLSTEIEFENSYTGWFNSDDKISEENTKKEFDGSLEDYFSVKTIMLSSHMKGESVTGYSTGEKFTFFPTGKYTIENCSENKFQPIKFDFIIAEKVAEFKTKVS